MGAAKTGSALSVRHHPEAERHCEAESITVWLSIVPRPCVLVPVLSIAVRLSITPRPSIAPSPRASRCCGGGRPATSLFICGFRLEFCIRRIYRFPLKLWLLPVPPLCLGGDKAAPAASAPGGDADTGCHTPPCPPWPCRFAPHPLPPFPTPQHVAGAASIPVIPTPSGARQERSVPRGAEKGDATFLMKTDWH